MLSTRMKSYSLLLKLCLLASGAAVANAAAAPSSADSASRSGTPTSSSATDASNPSDIPVTTAGFAPTVSNGPIFTVLADPAAMVAAMSADDPPDPIRDTLGASLDGPQNIPLQFENPDLIAPPTTDSGSVGNAKWPFALSHNRMQTGGWARQENGMFLQELSTTFHPYNPFFLLTIFPISPSAHISFWVIFPDAHLPYSASYAYGYCYGRR